MAETQTIDPRTRARYIALVSRVETDIRLAMDAALASGLEFKRLQRLKRARREINDELREIESTSVFETDVLKT